METVLVTGANGHVGYNIVQCLRKKNYNVKAGVRHSHITEKVKPLQELGAQICELDIMNPKTIEKAVDGVSGVFQVAAVYNAAPKNPQREIINPSIIGGINVLKAAEKAKVKKVIFTSSIAAIVSKKNQRFFTEEDWNDTPISSYAIAKTEAEKKAWKFAQEKGINLITLCPSMIIGPGFHRHTASTFFFEQVLREKVPVILPFSFTFVDVRDVAHAHILAYEKDHALGRYIVCNSYKTMDNLLKEIKELDSTIKIPLTKLPKSMTRFLPLFDWLGHKFTKTPRMITKSTMKEFTGKEQRVSNDKIRQELGWEPTDFRDSLRDTLDWIRKYFM
ncbi:NAD-dependent epimerase/dehydratase family protein [Candidatus Uabimicrobium sp. HlEnr_7]|uniref:NAD-dependent epimerase/dehydratase family protein n=1 Tax=Candidatus Uabimicrobium helgolandensis TaxID=3095367 RepID=UPI0035568F9C